MDKNLVEKFFINQTTPEETELVLKWFDTSEGKQYLQERLDIDYDLMDRKELRKMVPELDSNRMYHSIHKRIKTERQNVIRNPDRFAYAFKAAAAILVIILTSVFYIANYSDPAQEVAESEPIHVQTSDNENREITLSDGSLVRLNKNSEIVISENFMNGTREIKLSGEAFFNVAHNPEQPFIIHANQSTVRVLGTSFNVRSFPGQDNVQVAVVDGRVSFTNKNAVDSQTENENGIVLTKGQYAYMDIQKSTFQVDDVAVDNYLAWKNGQFVFDGQSLQQVCLQLNRIYGAHCSFESPEIRDLLLTADFLNESLEKTLSVISLTLKIEFENQSGKVHWFEGT